MTYDNQALKLVVHTINHNAIISKYELDQDLHSSLLMHGHDFMWIYTEVENRNAHNVSE